VVGPPQDAVKGVLYQVYTPPLLLVHHAIYDSMGYNCHIPNRPNDCREACMAQGSKVKPTSRVRATQSKQSEGQRDTRGGQQLALNVAPPRGPSTLKHCI
jgi:hypothetical protein